MKDNNQNIKNQTNKTDNKAINIMNNEGQITLEYILLTSIMVLILLQTTHTIIQENEKNTIQTAAQIGAQEGIDKNGYAMYYNDTYNNYQQNHPKLLNPTQIKLIKTKLIEKPNQTIDIQITIHTNTQLTTQEKNIIESRITYYTRKSIAQTLNIQTNDTFYENLQTKQYKIGRQYINWV